MGFVTTNTYDANGNLLSVTASAPGNGGATSVTRFGYDSKGELTQITDPLNNVTTMTYFPTGLIQTIADAQNHVTTYGLRFQRESKGLVGAVGIEPTTFGLKGRCSTTELRPCLLTTSYIEKS
jgi:YD repeat-containing protein